MAERKEGRKKRQEEQAKADTLQQGRMFGFMENMQKEQVKMQKEQLKSNEQIAASFANALVILIGSIKKEVVTNV